MAKLKQDTTPENVSEFERDQLRFFLADGDLATTLTELNPSLAWLPIFADLNLLSNDAALALWVERNFSRPEAVREVVSNIRFFKEQAASILEFRLNHQTIQLEPLLLKCWHLIIRHIRNTKSGALQNEWFDILARVKRGEGAPELMERVANVLTPKLIVEPRFHWTEKEPKPLAEKVSDLMSIKYVVDNGVAEDDFFGVWPASASVETEELLVRMLTNSLQRVLADATDVGVEANAGLSITDIDVPSVAKHAQNAYRAGFLPIVRIIAELWSRLIQKDSRKALAILADWEGSSFRLIHRLALYAAVDSKVPAKIAADVLVHLPQGELFLTNSQVEVHRLIRSRWSKFPTRQRKIIEDRIAKGPPADWFREGAELERLSDRYRFELLIDLKRSGVPLGKHSARDLAEIRRRQPQWRVDEPEKVGFSIWQGDVRGVVGDDKALSGIPSKQLIMAAKKAAADADFMDGDDWQALCQNEPSKAFKGIVSAPFAERWHVWAWRPLLWAANKISDPTELNRIATLLAKWPKSAEFSELSSGAAFWLNEVADKLKAPQLWAVWDLIERRAPRRTDIANDDPFGTALNDPAGNLASILLKRTPTAKVKAEFGKQLQARYDKLLENDDVFGLLARVRLSAAVAFLFERAPKWTTANIIPFYSWDSPHASAMWSARKYSNYIGSPELFAQVKSAFLEMFIRPATAEEDLRQFSDWLGVILIANLSGKNSYPLSPPEVRSVLRRASRICMSSFAHRLAIEMEAAKPGEKERVWSKYVGPVFQGAWPLDVELQTPEATFKLVQILLATGSAFREAATVIIPFIRPEDPRRHTSVFSIAEASEELYSNAPEKMLDLLSAVVGDASDRSVYSLEKALGKLRKTAPHLAESRQFKKLLSQASAH